MDVTRRSVKSKTINYNLIFRRIHKWLALIVGIQFVLWTLSGFIMSYFPIEDVHGDHLWDKSMRSSAVLSKDIAFDMKDLMAKYEGQDIRHIRLFSRNGRAAYEMRVKGKTLFIDANNGQPLTPVTEQQAISIAGNVYRWTGHYKSIEYVTDPEQYGEIRGKDLPIWKVNFDDDVNTSLYVSPDKGRAVVVRSDIWRRHDFFWMLHIMDYDKRENFNNLLLIFAVSVGLFIALSGVLLIFYAFSRRDFHWIRKR